MRIHELALQRFLNKHFSIVEGYPIPVLFTKPMDAFDTFQTIWQDPNNPFNYLLNAKDSKGTPLYLPFPAPVRLPMITVNRSNWTFAAKRNFGLFDWTVATHRDTATSKQQCMPVGWDYHLQVDHYCSRPDTQAYFIAQLQRVLQRSGGVPCIWIPCLYPTIGKQLIKIYLDGDITDSTEEESTDKNFKIYRTTLRFTVEGYWVDADIGNVPLLLKMVLTARAISPTVIAALVSEIDAVTVATRVVCRPDLLVVQQSLPPSSWPCQPEQPGNTPGVLPPAVPQSASFRFFNLGGQPVPQLLDISSGLWYTLGIKDVAGIPTMYIGDTGYPNPPTPTAPQPRVRVAQTQVFPYIPDAANFRFFNLNGQIVPQLLDMDSKLWYTIGIREVSGMPAIYIGDIGYN
jgi:hypothetical protein